MLLLFLTSPPLPVQQLAIIIAIIFGLGPGFHTHWLCIDLYAFAMCVGWEADIRVCHCVVVCVGL